MVHFRVFSLAFFYVAIVVSVFVLLAFHRAPLILNALGWGRGGGGVIHLLVVLFWLAFLSVSLFLVCFSGVVHMSQPVAG